jgi:hypothetical protein
MGMGMMVVSPRLVERRGERNVWKGKERGRIGI